MAEAVPAVGAARVSRLDRRKARTRQALINAVVRLIAEGRGDRASIAEITEEADIGFGSFYNHFDSKEQLFATASEEVLERWGQLIDRASAGITDSVPRSAACSGSSGCASGTPNASRRPPSTSLPRPSCACSVSPPMRPPASSPSPFRTPARGNTRDDAVDRVPRQQRRVAGALRVRGSQARG